MVPICEWFALCTNETDKGIDHSVIGLVPCCERCATKFDMTDQLVPLTVEEE